MSKGLSDVEAPTFSLDNRLTDGREVASLTSRPPFTPHPPPGRFGLLISVRGWVDQGHSADGRIRSIEKKNHEIAVCQVEKKSDLYRTSNVYFVLKISLWLQFYICWSSQFRHRWHQQTLTLEHRAVDATVNSSVYCILVQERNSPECSLTAVRLNDEPKEENDQYVTGRKL
jgi:hypothetical protein